MLTASQKKMFEKLLENDAFKGKDQLRHLLWLNTTIPKHSVGDCFLVSEPGHRVFGHPVRNFKGKIIGVHNFKTENVYRYTLEGIVKCGDRQTPVRYYSSESDLVHRCEDNITVVEDINNSCSSEIELSGIGI